MEFWIVANIAAFMLGLSKGGLPVVAMLSVPLMSFFMDPILAAGLLLPLYIVADWYAIYLFRKTFSMRNLKILVPAALVGIIVAYFVVSHVSGDFIKLLVGFIGIWYVAKAFYGRFSQGDVPKKPADVPRGLFWGALAGLTSYISHAGGPPYQNYVLPQKLEKMTYLGTTAIVFAFINLMKAPPYVLAGQLSWETLGQVIWLAPTTLIGAWSGSLISRRMPEKLFYLLLEIALALMSIKLVYDAILA